MSRRRPLVSASLMVVFAVAAPAIAQPAGESVRLWGGGPPPDGSVAGLDEQGVQILRTDGVAVTLDWTRVKSVSGDRSADFEPLRETARMVWRADSRLARGDHVNAEPLFETLFGRYHASPGPTSSVVARGLLECRLRSAAGARAVAPWLGVLRVEEYTPEQTTTQPTDPLIDPGTGLVPALAPIWLSDNEAAWLARTGVEPSISETTDGGSVGARLRALEGLYTLAAAFESNPGGADQVRRELDALVAGLDARTLREPGVQLVFEIVTSRVGAPEARAAATASLRARLGGAPGWQEVWIRIAVGRSMLLDPDTETRRRGVVELLHIPARLEPAPKRLAALALAEAAVACRALGDRDVADALRRDLLERFPDSPAARWTPIQTWDARAALHADEPHVTSTTDSLAAAVAAEGTPTP